MEPNTAEGTPDEGISVAGADDSAGLLEVPQAREIQQPEDILSPRFQADLAQVLTPIAILGVVALWARNMTRGRSLARTVDGLVAPFSGVFAARRASKKGVDDGSAG